MDYHMLPADTLRELAILISLYDEAFETRDDDMMVHVMTELLFVIRDELRPNAT